MPGGSDHHGRLASSTKHCSKSELRGVRYRPQCDFEIIANEDFLEQVAVVSNHDSSAHDGIHWSEFTIDTLDEDAWVATYDVAEAVNKRTSDVQVGRRVDNEREDTWNSAMEIM